MGSTRGGERTRPRVLFYSHDGYGLGHIRITLAVAGALSERRPDAALLVLTGSLQAHAYELPPNLDYVKLPAVGKEQLYRGVPAGPDHPHGLQDVWRLRAAVIQATADAFAPDLVVVDQAPAGLGRELVGTLARLRARRRHVASVLVLRDITDGPETTRAQWRADGVYDLLDHAYDRILVLGSRDLFDPVREYGFSPAAAAKTVFCGYVKRSEPTLPPERVRDQLGVGGDRLVVVTAGGGGDGGTLLRAYLAAVRGGMPAGLASVVVAGPLLGEAERAELAADADRLPCVTFWPFRADLVSILQAAEVVVTMGGYNAVCEAVSLGKRPIVVPRALGSEEQLMRAERFAQRSLVTVLRADELTPERLRQAVLAELNRCTTPASVLDFGGLRNVGDVLAGALAH